MSRLDKPLREVLNEWERSMAEDGITECNSHKWLKEHVDTGTVADFDAYIASDLAEGPPICWQIIRDCYRYNSEKDALDIQRACVDTLISYPFKVARGAIETVMETKLPGPVDQDSRKKLVEHIIKHHRRAKAFLQQSHIRGQLHEGFAPETLPDDPSAED